MTDTDLKQRLANFPKDGYEQIEELLAAASTTGKSPVNARTIRKIIHGVRTDNHGVVAAFVAMTDAVDNALTSAKEELKEQFNG